MSKKSDDFEKKITRIKDVLETSSALITWNDKMPDPDNKEQPRQIDISIKKDDKVTHVECRIHKDPQNVKWIEELIGRKISLGVDSMIGVSASGFTNGAIKKANAKGIILRNLSQITPEEAESWGEKSDIEIIWLSFINTKFNFIFPKDITKTITEKEIIHWIKTNQNVVYEMIAKIANEYPKPENPTDDVKRSIQSEFDVSHIPNHLGFEKISIESDLEYVRISEEVVHFYSYGDPQNENVNKRTTLEETSTNSIELIYTLERIGITLDLSKITRPDNHIFRAVGWRIKRPSKDLVTKLVSTFDRKFSFENLRISVSSK